MALYHGCKATTVLKENDLLLPLQRIVHLLDQHGRERSLHALLSGEFLDVHLLDVRKADILVSLLQFHQAILAIGGIEIGFHAGGSRAQEHLGPIHGSQHDGRTPGMIARSRVLLLVSIFVFLVHNHELQVLEGQEDGRTDSQDDLVGFITQLLLPDFHTLGIGELGVIDTQPITKYSFQSLGDLCSQGDFGQEIEHLTTALFQGLGDEVDIDFGLATGGDPMKQTDILLTEAIDDGVVGCLLSRIEGMAG